jgi:polyisoprenoid-binding protein YceI
LGTGAAANAVPVTYDVDPNHTYPSFEADHMGGVSVWRGKFNRSSGKIVLDREKKAGTVQIIVDVSSIDFGHDKLNEHIQSPDMLDVKQFPTATFKGQFAKFDGDTPREVHGDFTLHGVTKPLTLLINQFLCKPHPMTKKEVCGADASASFDRIDYGMDFGKAYGSTIVKLAIQVEAKRVD